MKRYSFEKFKENKKRKEKAKAKTKLSIIIIIITAVIVIVALYMANANFRKFVDVYILRKEIYENDAVSLQIDTEGVSLIYAFNNNIVVLDGRKLSFYNSNAKETANLDIEVVNPVVDSDDKYLVIGNEGDQELYLIKGNDIAWRKEIEGKISKVNVNKNGYVSVIATDTTHESFIIIYDQDGNKKFNLFLSKTYAIASDISDSNEYLGIAEIDYSGVKVQSNIKIVSMEKANNSNEDDAFVNKFSADEGEIITNIQYQEKNTLLCSFNDSIVKVTPSSAEKIYQKADNTMFMDCGLDKHYARIDKESSGVFKSNYRMKINETEGNKEKVYILENTPKKLKVCGDKIAINMGKETQFINTNAWLVKKYIGTKEIKDIILSDNIAGIVYENKIDIISL